MGKWIWGSVAVTILLIGLACSGLILVLAWEQGMGLFVLILYSAVLGGIYYVYSDTKASEVLEQSGHDETEGDKV